MIEIALAIAACGAMAKIADADGRSSIAWGVITLAICAASFAIPLPFLRVLLAFIVAFVLMMVAKARAGR
jgi:succinate-acetate transporter protein